MKPYYKEAFEFINKFQTLSKSEFDILYNIASYKQVKNGEQLLKLRTVPKKLYFISKGVVRCYLILANGKEITTNLYNPFMFFGSFKALLNQEPTELIYQTLTDCHIFEIDFNTFYSLCRENKSLMSFYAKFLEHLIIKGQNRFIEFSSKDATERYLLLRERIPNLDNIIPQYQIAASIGITPVQLSRIRSKL